MPSRIIIGAGAWLLGAASATAGSLYAIAQLGHGLVEQHTAQVTVAMVNAELAQDSAIAPSASPVSKPSSTAAPKASRSAAPQPSGGKRHATAPVTQWLSSDAGTVEASCSADGAQLLYESPVLGFGVDWDHLVPGPGPVASVPFVGSSFSVVMKVTCDSGIPVAQVSRFQPGGGGWHHDE